MPKVQHVAADPHSKGVHLGRQAAFGLHNLCTQGLRKPSHANFTLATFSLYASFGSAPNNSLIPAKSVVAFSQI